METEQIKSARVLPWMYIALLYIAPLYTYIVASWAKGVGANDKSILPILSIVLGIILYLSLIIVGIVNCVMAWVNCKKDREEYLLGCLAIFKYATIPFNIACAFMILAGSLIFLFGGFLLIILGIIIQGGGLLVSICYAWSYIVVTVKNGKRSKEMAVLHCLMLAIYVVDVIDTLVIMFKQKKYIVSSVMVIIGSIIGIIYFISKCIPR